MAQGLGWLQDGGIFPLARVYLPEESGDMDIGIPERISPELLIAAQEDDVNGSGIFGDANNLHSADGVFADRVSMPGYAARETGTGPSEVVDWQTGTPIMSFADGFRSGGWAGSYTTAPQWTYRNGISYPDIRGVADAVDFGSRPIPSSNTWSAQQATPVEPVVTPPMKLPPVFQTGATGADGGQGTPVSPVPLYAPGRGPAGQVPAVQPGMPTDHFRAQMIRDMRPNPMHVDAGAARITASNANTAAMMQPYRGQQTTAMTITRAPLARSNQPSQVSAAMGQRRTGATPTVMTTPRLRQPARGASGLGALGALGSLGEFSLDGFGSIGKVVAWGVVAGLAVSIVADVLDIDVVQEVKDLVR